MGCSAGDGECYENEKPGRDVVIPNGFWMQESEVTQGAYERVIGSNPSSFKGSNRPVEQVSWYEAKTYCERVELRLPTEAEWEYAARGGTAGARYGKLEAVAWYGGNSGNQTHEVKGKDPNAHGLYDMWGNVSEWTASDYDVGQSKTLRGGSWYYGPRGVGFTANHCCPKQAV
jgi:formylglycine-generating enzyme required for sulfatase activity